LTLKPDFQDARHGTLYVVATPIGNPEDITLRAIRVLGAVDWIAAEDTRFARRLLYGHDVSARLISLYEHNEQRRTPELMRRLVAGESGALISNAGTPTISDPGYRLVSTAAAAGIAVVPVPGPTAAAAALSASGMPTDAFVFLGFPPKKDKALRRFLERLESEEKTLIFYESPVRIVSFLRAAESVFSDRRAFLAREMTKPHEEFLRGRLSQIRRRLTERKAVKGECTLIVAGAAVRQPADAELTAAVKEALAQGMGVSEAAKTVAARFGVARGRVYPMALGIRKRSLDP